MLADQGIVVRSIAILMNLSAHGAGRSRDFPFSRPLAEQDLGFKAAGIRCETDWIVVDRTRGP
jgi:hypothetical protein